VDKGHPPFVHYRLPCAAIANPSNDQVQTTRHPIVKMIDDGISTLHPLATKIAYTIQQSTMI
jgi:hypothetical protein